MNKTYRYKINSGVSIIELLIVMLVFMVVASLGFQAISSFKTSTELSSAATQFESSIKTIQNNARNNVVSRIEEGSTDKVDIELNLGQGNPGNIFSSQTSAYLLFFLKDINSYEIRSCKYDGSEYDCSNLEPATSLPLNTVSFKVSSDMSCAGIMYENLSGEMSILANSVTNPDIAFHSSDFSLTECQVEVMHVKEDFDRIYKYKFTKNGNKFERLKN